MPNENVPENPFQRWPQVRLVEECDPNILFAEETQYVFLEFHTRDVLTVHDGQIRRTVASPHRDTHPFAISLKGFRSLVAKIEDELQR